MSPEGVSLDDAEPRGLESDRGAGVARARTTQAETARRLSSSGAPSPQMLRARHAARALTDPKSKDDDGAAISSDDDELVSRMMIKGLKGDGPSSPLSRLGLCGAHS